jgi:hypothetical protein
MSQTIDNSSGQSPKLLIATALITAVATIGAAFLGVIPNLLGNGSKAAAPSGTKTMKIVGTVSAPNNGPPLGWVELYLVPTQNPKLISQTTANGEFTFPDVPDGQYFIVVRDTEHGKSGGSIMDKDSNHVKVDGALVNYHVEK